MQQFFQQLINGLSVGAVYALIAIGYTMVYGVLRLINFAHGDVVMVGAMTGYYAARNLLHLHENEPTWFAFFFVLLICMIVCGVLGYVIEFVAYRPLRNQPRINSLITAIGVSMLLEYGGQAWLGADPKVFPQLIPNIEGAHSALATINGVIIGKLDAIILTLSITLMLILRYIIMHTRTGLALRAVSFRFDTAALMGVNVNRIVSFTFVLGSSLAAVAGVLLGIRSHSVGPLLGLQIGIKAFVAAVLGGIGNINGAVCGAMLLGLTEVMVAGYVKHGSQFQNGVAFVILIGVLLLKPSGIFGQNVVEKI